MNNSDQKWHYQFVLFFCPVFSWYEGSSLYSSELFDWYLSPASLHLIARIGLVSSWKMQLKIMTLQSLQPWYHGKREWQCAEQKNKHFRGVKKKKKTKSICKFCGREERNRGGSGRKQLSGCFTHLLKPHMYQPRLRIISTAYKLSYLVPVLPITASKLCSNFMLKPYILA